MADEKDVLTKEGLLAHLGTMKSELADSLTTEVSADVQDKIKEKMEAVDKVVADVATLQKEAVSKEIIEKLQADMDVTIKAFDLLQSRTKGSLIIQPKMIKSIGEAIEDKLSEKGAMENLWQQMDGAGGSATIKLGNVSLKDMTLANSLTGDPVATYNDRQAIIPTQKVNFRDLIPTVISPTGLYVTYSENTGAVNNIAKQVEGALKGQNEYALTELKTVASYIAGFTVFTKQLLKFLPFMSGTLTRMLLRDFYKKENQIFFNTVSGVVGAGSGVGGSSPDDALQLINAIGAQLDTDYDVSVIVVSNSMMARLVGATYSKGYYAGAGSVVLNGARGITLFGVPVVAASWVPSGYALMIDRDYVERIEVEGLNVTFSYEDSDNFRRNKVTAKVECMEEINIMRPSAVIYMNLGVS